MTMSIHEFLRDLIECQKKITDFAPLVEVLVDDQIRQVDEIRCEHNAFVIVTSFRKQGIPQGTQGMVVCKHGVITSQRCELCEMEKQE